MEDGYEVLVVDDEPVIRRGIKKMLETSGRPISNIRLASSGKQAIEMIHEHSPHFIFTDIRMPDMDGIELAETIQQHGWPIQIVVISGFGEFEYAQKCLSYGVKEYLLKPVRTDDFERVLEKLFSAARTDEKANLSLKELDAFTERISDAVWYLEEIKLKAVLKEWKMYTDSLNLPIRHYKQLIEDALSRIIKLLNAKDIYPFDEISEEESALAKAADHEQAYRFYEETIDGMLQHLQRKRKGNLIDPIEAAKQYIESHLNKEVSLEEVADYLGLNPSYFSQLFKQHTKETFVHYRMKKRMELARQLLQNASVRMYDIAEQVGYSDYSHFAKTFKKWFGVSPTEFRTKLGVD